MPVFPEGQDPLDAKQGQSMAYPIGAPPQPYQPPPTWGQTIAAEWRLSDVGSVVQRIMGAREDMKPVPGYNPLDNVIGSKYEPYAKDFLGDINPAQTSARMARIDQEEKDTDTAEKSGIGGTLTGIGMGLLNPIWYIPIGGEVGAGLGAAKAVLGRVGTGAVEGAVDVATKAAISDAVARSAQETRPPETVTNIGVNAILGGILGAGIGFLSPAERKSGADAIRNVRSAPLADTGVGAATAEQRTMELAKIGIAGGPGLEIPKWMLFASPVGRTLVDEEKSLPGKLAVGDLAETSLKFKQSEEGITAARGVPLDRLVRMQTMMMTDKMRGTLERGFSEYSNIPNDMLMRVKAGVQSLGGGDRLNFNDFKTEVYKALYSGDESSIPEVEKAAGEIRKNVIDPVKEFAQSVKGPDGKPMLAEDLSAPKGDKSFAPRLWNKEAIARDPNGFDGTVTQWLGAEQAEKARIKSKLGPLFKRFNAAREAGRLDEADNLRGAIEDEIQKWEGNTSKEAKAAMLSRMQAEAERKLKAKVEGKEGSAVRLTSADRAVENALKRILAAPTDKSQDELLALAREIRNRINSASDGRLPYDTPSGGPKVGFPENDNQVRGSLNSRDFAIPSAKITQYIHTDPEHVIPAYLRTVLPDVHLTERFGDVDMTETFKKINDHYDKLAAKKESEKALKALDAKRKAEIRDVAALRDKVRGVYGLPTTEVQRNMGRLARAVSNWNVGSFLGSSVLNRMQDMGNATWRRGLLGYFQDGFLPYIQGMMKVNKASTAEREIMKDLAVGVDTHMGHLATTFSDVVNDHLPGNRFERGLQAAAQMAMTVTGHGPWTDMNKQIAGMAAMADFLRMSDRIAGETGSARDIRVMADAGISKSMAGRISGAFNSENGHTIVNGRKIPNLASWPAGARQAFEAAIGKDADIAVVTPGLEKPLFMSEPMLALMGQFKSFSMAAYERIMLSNLQQMDGRTLQGFAHMAALGALSYRLYTLATGQPTSDRPQDWVKEIARRAAFFGWMSDVNDMQAKVTGGKTDIWRVIGADRPLTRHQSQDALQEMLGPTFNSLDTLRQAAFDASQKTWNAQDTHNLRQVMYLQNHFLIRQLLDKAEDGINEHFGIRPMNRNPTTWPGPGGQR